MSGHLLSLCDIKLTFGGAPLLDGARLDIAPGARLALVGRNGAGKSTLLKIAAGAVIPDQGERFTHPAATLRYLPQEPTFEGFATAQDYILSGADAATAGGRMKQLTQTFDIDPATALNACSGGEARRIAIAAALIADPDILLLDEPTNHLDLPGIARLEELLADSKSAMVIISHDRRFLEKLTTQTVWIDRGQTRHLNRGFKDFESWRDKCLEEDEAAHHKLGRKIAAEEDWLRYGVTARRKRNMRRLGELHALRKQLRESRPQQNVVTFSISSGRRAGKRIIVADSISKAYGETVIVKDFSTEIVSGEKIGIVGPNGAGKTTLVNMLTGRAAPDSGAVQLGANMQLVTLDQRRASLKPEMRLADAIADQRGDWVTINGEKRHVATYLQDFLFAPEQWRAPVASLSGGERGRLALAAALAHPSNILALDEPTNDLDLETLDLLEEMLAAYEGTVLLISHDRSFLDRIVTSIITTDPEAPGAWRRYPGGYDDMIAQRGRAPGMASNKADRQNRKTPQKPQIARDQNVATKAAKLSYKEKYALETLPSIIAAREKEIGELKAALADPGFYDRDAAGFNEAAATLARAEQALKDAEEEWLELELKREALDL